MDINREKVIWAAGFFDGEGNVNISRVRVWKWLQLTIAQTDVRVLDRFQTAVGGLGKIYGPYDRQTRVHKNWIQFWVFKANSFEHVQAIIVMLYPFLSPVKQTQVLKYLHEMRTYHTEERRYGA